MRWKALTMNCIRVLLVDDEEPVARVLAERLSARNLTVSTAFSGRAALSLLERIEISRVDNLEKRIREAVLEPVRRGRSEAGAVRRP